LSSCNYFHPLVWIREQDALLHDLTSVLIARYLLEVLQHWCKDHLVASLCPDEFQTLLNDVVATDIAHQLEDPAFLEAFADQFGSLLGCLSSLDAFIKQHLKCPSATGVLGDAVELGLDSIKDFFDLGS